MVVQRLELKQVQLVVKPADKSVEPLKDYINVRAQRTYVRQREGIKQMARAWAIYKLIEYSKFHMQASGN